MAFNIDEYDFEDLIDEGRRLIIEELGRQLENYPEPICICNECVLDMAALALNSIVPRYRCSLLGSIYQSESMNDPEYADSLKGAVSVAIKRVKNNPGHD